MASVVLPQVQVFQQFTATPTELTQPLRAFLFGPEFRLHRYNVASEKALAGAYDPLLGNSFNWLSDLGRQAGASVDLSYTKVYLENALLEYFNDASSAQSASINGSFNASLGNAVISTPIGSKNKIRFNERNLVDKTDYPLDSALEGRDVKVGDYAKVSIVLDSVRYDAGGVIIGLEADQVDATVGAAAPASGNKATTLSAGPTPTTVVGSIPILVTGTYSGVKVGVLSETYTIEVIRGSTGYDPSTMIVNITSASGKDSVLGYKPTTTNYTSTMPLGANGLLFRFNPSPSTTEIPAGAKWTVTVTQAFTKPVATSAGTYTTGPSDTTYILTVTRGGTIGAGSVDDRPIIQVTTSTGVDGSPPRTVASGAFTVGNHGVTVTWAQSVLCAGDQYYIPVTAVADGPVRTIVLNKSLPDVMVTTSASNVRDLSVTLNIRKNLELPAEIFTLALTNWSQNATTITFDPGMREFDSSWLDGTEALPIMGGDIYVHWRELITDRANRIYEVTSLSDLTTLFDTQIDPDNPLVYAATKALANSGLSTAPSTGIRMMAVPTNDVAGYTFVLGLAESRDDVYTFVPLTFNKAIQDLVVAHVQSTSTPEIGLWRVAFLCSEEENPQPLIKTNSDSSAVLATTDSSGYLDLDSSADVGFITKGVRAGDLVRLNYGNDNYGNTTYDTYTVDEVLSESRVLLTEAPSPVIGTPSKVEVWRTPTADDSVDQIGDKVGGFTSRRVYNVYPSKIKSGGVYVDGYHLCAAIAGLIGSSAPQQGLTNVEINGFDDARNVIDRFTRSQLDRLASFGVWIVTQDMQTGDVFTRHQLSTDTVDLNARELNIVKNVDAISYFFLNRLKPFIGRANVTDTTLEVIRTQIDGGISFLKAAGFSALLGGQVLEGTAIRELRAHTVLRDRIVIIIDLVVPYPLNNVELYLVV